VSSSNAEPSLLSKGVEGAEALNNITFLDRQNSTNTHKDGPIEEKAKKVT
jgi:hypothetical protein